MTNFKCILTCVITFLISFGLNSQGGFRKRIDIPNSSGSRAIAAFETSPDNFLIISKALVIENGFNVYKLDFINYNSTSNTYTLKQIGDSANSYDNIFSAIRNYGKKIDNHIYLANYAKRSQSSKYFGVFLKISLNGDTIWQRKYNTLNEDIFLFQSCKTTDGGFFLTGRIVNSSYNSRLLLIKTDSNGNELWRKIINGPPPNYYEGRDVIQDSLTKHIIVTGCVFKINSLGKQHESKFVLLLDSLGNQLNNISATYGYDNSSAGISKDKLNNYYIFGYKVISYEGFNPKSVGFITKFTVNGNVLTQIYDKVVGEINTAAAFVSLSIDQEQNLHVVGLIDTCLFKNKPLTYMVQLLKVTPNGDLIWKKYYNYTYNVIDWDLGVGAMGGNLIKNNGLIVPVERIKNNTPAPVFFVKYDSLGCDTSAFYCATVGIKENSYQTTDVSIYPQPAKQVVNLSSPLFANKSAQIQLSNNLGQLFFKQNLKFNNGTLQVPIANLPKGIYSLKLIDENLKTFTQKIIVE